MFEKESDDVLFRTFRPVLEDVIVLDLRTKLLSVKATTREEREAYVWQIATLTGKPEELFREALNSRIYTLGPIQDGRFSYQGDGLIQGVRLVRAKYHLQSKASVEYKAEDVNALLAWDGFPQGTLVGASLCFGFRTTRQRLKWVRADVTPPSRGKLPDEYTLEVDRYLRDQGVKLR